ncbi:MAG: polyhydroxyalkanoate depolymerase [Pseudomonadota bacterium]
MAWSLYKPENAERLAEQAVADTGLGNVADKVIKNQRKTFGTLRDLMRARTVGISKNDNGSGIIQYGKPVGVTETIALQKDFCALRHFARATTRQDPRVLLVAPLSGHFATLLRGTVKTLLPDHDVYVTDWADAGMVPVEKGQFSLDDYTGYIVDFLRFLGPDTHVIAVCQPSVPVLAAVALMAEDKHADSPRSMTLMGGPIDTRNNPTKVNQFATTRTIDWFRKTVISTVPFGYPGAGRQVYPGFLQLTGFMSMNMDRHLGAHLRHFHHLIRGDGDSAAGHRRFYDEYMSVMDLPGQFYLQTVKTVFQDHALPKGEMMSGGRRVDPAAITKTALMTVEGELDDISAVGQTRAAQDLCVNIPVARRTHLEQQGVGHYGIFNGRRWRDLIYPKVRDFIRAHG